MSVSPLCGGDLRRTSGRRRGGRGPALSCAAGPFHAGLGGMDTPIYDAVLTELLAGLDLPHWPSEADLERADQV